MGRYTDEFKEEILGYNLVINGICSVEELRTTMSLSDVMKCTEALMIKSELGSFE